MAHESSNRICGSNTKLSTPTLCSGESSTYFGYQAQSSYYSFLESGQTGGAWARLNTGARGDDMMDTFPTFTAKRHPYSRKSKRACEQGIIIG